MKTMQCLLVIFISALLCIVLNDDADAQHGARRLRDGIKPTSRDRLINEMLAPGTSSGSPYYTDNFNGANDTTALKARGYKVYFRGTGPQGDSAMWFQGNAGVFVAFNGPTNGYLASNYETITAANRIDNWLVLPPLNVAVGDSLFFYERSRSPFTGFADSLIVMYSAAGDSVPQAASWTMLGYFQTTTTGTWTRRGFRAPASGAAARWAIRYFIVDGGELGSNGDYVGIDLLTVERPDVLNDVGPVVNIAPVGTIQAHGATIAPKATFRNFGLSAQSSISVSYSISPGGYQSTKTIASLAPGASATVTFDSTFVPTPVGSFNVTILTNLGTDQNRLNDTLRSSFNVVELNWGGGGLNSGGYYFANSVSVGAPSRPTYAWVDPVASAHTQITAWTQGNADDGYFRVPAMPFSFTYFGLAQPADSLFIGTNGYVSFRRGYTETASAASIPNTGTPNNYIAGCAMDLDLRSATSPAAKVYYGGNATSFVVTYLNARTFGSATDSITFQIILQQNGKVKVQYNDGLSTITPGNDVLIDALLGLENGTGTLGIQYRNDGVGGPIFGSPLAIEYGTNPGTLAVDEAPGLPRVFDLSQNYPNPFNPTTTIRYALPVDATVSLTIYSTLGQKIAQLVDGHVRAGNHDVSFDASHLASGVYLYRLIAGDFVQTRKLLVLR